MKKIIFKTVVAGLFMVGMTGLAIAQPILNDDGSDGFEDVGGTPYATYVNSYDFLGINEGNLQSDNAASIAAFEAFLLILGFDVDISAAEVTYTGVGETSGTWMTSGEDAGSTIDFYTVKAANAYAVYIGNPAESSGSWSTFDLNAAGYGGSELAISHFNGWNPGETPPVPEPATMLLLGTGLVGLAGFSRKKGKSN